MVLNEKTGCKHVQFYGSSENPSIHRKLLKYFDSINLELKKAVDLSETFQHQQYLLSVKTNVENKIRTKGFNFSDFRLTLDYIAVTNLLMGKHIYGEEKYGLRELVQNSIDACKIMQEESYGKNDFRYTPYIPFINIVLDQDKKQVSIFDNGKGMSLDILKKYFLNVGVSYYISDEYRLRGNNYNPIGNYGIGFLACFMLSDKVVVNTKFYGETKLNTIEFEKNSEYICLNYEENPCSQGTEIILNYDQFFKVFDNNQNKIRYFIESNFLDSGIPINVISAENGKINTVKCDLSSVVGSDSNSIVLDEYLKNIEGYIEVNYKSVHFVETLKDVNGYDSYIYDPQSSKLIEESETGISVKDLIEDGHIRFLRIPIIERCADAFNKAYEVLDSFDDALEKVNDYEMVNIICRDTTLYSKDEIVVDSDKIIDEFSYSDFCEEFSHSKTTPTYTYLKSQKVIINDNKKMLPYNVNIFIGGNYSFSAEEKIYIKNVLVSEARLKIPYLVDGIRIKKAVFNITNRKFVPNVSRNNLSETSKQDLSYAIGKALHLWILDHGNLSLEEKELLKGFIKACYPENNYCLKSQNE